MTKRKTQKVPLARLIFLFTLLCTGIQASASTFVVTTVNDTVNARDEVLSLREAIIAVNRNVGKDERCQGTSLITFALPKTNASVENIRYYQIKINYRDPAYLSGSVPTPLPVIRCPVIIDAYSQPKTSGAPAPTPGSPLIELSGEDINVGFEQATIPSQTPDDDERYAAGLVFVGRDSLTGKKLRRDPSGSTVKGLLINKFPLHAIYLYGVDDSTIVGNSFGLDVTGEKAGFHNGRDLNAIHAGVRLESANHNSLIRNYFGSNQAVQISLVDFNARTNGYGLCSTELYPFGCRHLELGSSRNVIQGNYFGLNKSGTRSLGGFCGPKLPMGIEKCRTDAQAKYSAYASVFFQSVPDDTDQSLSTIHGNVVGGLKQGEGNVMAGAIASEISLSAPGNWIVGNTMGLNRVNTKTETLGPTSSSIFLSEKAFGNLIQGNMLKSNSEGYGEGDLRMTFDALSTGPTNNVAQNVVHDNFITIDLKPNFIVLMPALFFQITPKQ